MKTSNCLKIAALAAVLPLAALTSARGQVSLNFTLPDIVGPPGYEAILNYYNGGADANGAIGPNYGITFGSDALALGRFPITGSNTGDEPGGGNGMIFLSGTEDLMNVPAGFTGGFSFYYDCSPVFGAGYLNVWSGVNDTGTLLATLPLPATMLATNSPNFSIWTPLGVTFSGTAESVDFGGVANEIAFADVTLGSGIPIVNSVPDNTGLGIYALAALALAGAAWASRKQKLAAI